MKRLPPKRARVLTLVLAVIGAFALIAGLEKELSPLTVAGYVAVAFAVLIEFAFCRCPHCGKNVGRGWGDFCPHCGKPLDE